jgi:hypothetical protein
MRNSLKTYFGLAILLMALGFSSCFDIVEEYTFNADGSGKAKMEMDISKMMALMEGMGSVLDSTGEGGEMGNSMNEMFDDTEAMDALKGIPGISNVINLNSRDTKVIGYSFDFKNIDALNSALVVRGSDFGMGKALGMSGSTDNETEKDNSISFVGKKFSRKMDMKMEEGDDEDDETKQAAEMAKMMFKDAKYTLRYTFASNVKKVKGNDAAVVGADGKSVTIENSLGDLLEGKTTMSTDIRLK